MCLLGSQHAVFGSQLLVFGSQRAVYLASLSTLASNPINVASSEAFRVRSTQSDPQHRVRLTRSSSRPSEFMSAQPVQTSQPDACYTKLGPNTRLDSH